MTRPLRAVLLVAVLLLPAATGCLQDQPDTGPIRRLLDAGDEVETSATPGTGAPEPTGGFSDTDVFPGEYRTGGGFSRTLAAGPYAAHPYEVVALTSDADGIRLPVGLVRPDVPEGVRVPVVVQASPYYHANDDAVYNLDPADPERGPQRLHLDLRHHYYARPLLENLVGHGFAVALVPVRGTAGTGGCTDALGPLEQGDLAQVVTWLGTRNWSNGRVGMFGLSYDGGAAWSVAATGNPHLKTIVPVSGVNDLFSASFRNGTRTPVGAAFAAGHYGNSNLLFQPFPGVGRDAADAAGTAACPQLVEGARSGLTRSLTPEDADPWWTGRDFRPGVEAHYRGSVFLVQGLRDVSVGPQVQYPWVHDLEARGIVVKHLLGQWSHTYPDWDRSGGINGNPTVRWDFAEVLLHWFDHWLRENTTVDLGPKVQVADTRLQWRSETAWPPADARPRTFHLAPDGALTPTRPDGSARVPVGLDAARSVPYTDLVGGPSSVDETIGADTACAACAVFRTGPMAEDLRFAGLPRFDVTVTPSGPGGYLTARLYAVDGTGTAQRLSGGQIDLRFADGSGTPRDVAPMAPLAVNLTLDPTDAVVPRGHRLVLVVTQATYGDFALFTALPSTPPSPVLLEVGGSASTLTLATFHRGADAFFTPPGT